MPKILQKLFMRIKKVRKIRNVDNDNLAEGSPHVSYRAKVANQKK